MNYAPSWGGSTQATRRSSREMKALQAPQRQPIQFPPSRARRRAMQLGQALRTAAARFSLTRAP